MIHSVFSINFCAIRFKSHFSQIYLGLIFIVPVMVYSFMISEEIYILPELECDLEFVYYPTLTVV